MRARKDEVKERCIVRTGDRVLSVYCEDKNDASSIARSDAVSHEETIRSFSTENTQSMKLIAVGIMHAFSS